MKESGLELQRPKRDEGQARKFSKVDREALALCVCDMWWLLQSLKSQNAGLCVRASSGQASNQSLKQEMKLN